MRFASILCFLSLLLVPAFSVGDSGRLSNGPALTLDNRIHYQRAIEEIYWKHRLWPKENSAPKPALDAFLPAEALRAKVEDYLQKSDALEMYWQSQISGVQLQAEMERMGRETKQPAVLRELFAALDNDPRVIAECLARPILADRLIHKMYAGDERLHGAPKPGSTAATNGGVKRSFEEWWKEAKLQARTEIFAPVFPYVLPDTQPVSASQADGTWSPTSTGPATGRYWHTAVWTGTEMVIWGGFDGSTPYLNTGARYNPATNAWAAGGTSMINAPTARARHTVVWTGAEMIVWGGYDASTPYLNTGGRYNPATDTWASGGTSITNAPSARDWHSAVWTGAKMIVWGGGDGLTYPSAGALYDPASDTWQITSTVNAPAGRNSHTAVWTGSEMIIWGGYDGVSRINTGGRYNPVSDTWVAGGTDTTGAPGARTGHVAVWTGTEMVIWGGLDSSAFNLNTGARYNPATNAWAAGGTSTINVPTARCSHSGIWTGTRMVVWGGIAGGQFTNTGGQYDPAADTWTTTGTSMTNAPLERADHTAVWTGTEMIVWGGNGSGGMLMDSGGRYNPTSDTWVAGGTGTEAPTPRDLHTAVWTGAEMIVWGGMPTTGTGARYNPATNDWAATKTDNAPTGRRAHTAVWTGTEMIVWGGYDGGAYVNTGGRYNPATDTWAAGGTTTSGAATAREFHTAVWTGSEMIIWGGSAGDPLNTGGRYNPFTDTWAAGGTNITNAPTGRFWHTAVWTGSEMIVWGGWDNVTCFNTGGRYDPVADTWTAGGTALNDAPVGRYYHTAAWTGAEMIVWGGIADGGSPTNTGGRYNPTTDAWASGGTSAANAPAARHFHTAIWTGTKMIVWGGYDYLNYLNTGGVYDPAADAWAPAGTAMDNSPSGRLSHTAVWTGSEMIVWGGTDGMNYLNTGGVYRSSLFSDDFEDGIQPDWQINKPSFTETGGNYVGTPAGRKAEAVATPVFAGCQTCYFESTIATAGGVYNKVWMLPWYADKTNLVEVLIKQENSRIILKQRINKYVVAKAKSIQTILPDTFYRIRADFDGSAFHLYLDGNLIITMTPGGTVPVGSVGFRVKNTTGKFGEVTVN